MRTTRFTECPNHKVPITCATIASMARLNPSKTKHIILKYKYWSYNTDPRQFERNIHRNNVREGSRKLDKVAKEKNVASGR